MGILRRKKCLAGVGMLALLAGIVWWQRAPLLAWYYTIQLAQASEANRGDWLDRVVSFDAAVVPRLLAYLQDPDPRACENAGAALSLLAERWGTDDLRSTRLLEDLLAGFDALDPSARQSALQVRRLEESGNRESGNQELVALPQLFPDYLIPDYLIPDYLIPDYLIPDYLIPDYLIPTLFLVIPSSRQ